MAISRLPAVKAKTGHSCQASIYNAVREGLFPKPVKIGERASGWPDDEIDAVITARIAGASKEQIRELVKQLHAQRATKLQTLLGSFGAVQ